MSQHPHQQPQTATPALFKPGPLASPSPNPRATGSPGKARLLRLLLAADGGMVSRHAIADDVGCVNVSDLVQRVKDSGVPILSDDREHTDRDGRRSRIGLYGLATDEARAKARQLLARLDSASTADEAA